MKTIIIFITILFSFNFNLFAEYKLCGEFGLECNIEKGRCDTICQGVGSCPDGYTCVNSCEKIID